MLISKQKVPYAAIEDQWVGFDDKDSVKEKVLASLLTAAGERTSTQQLKSFLLCLLQANYVRNNNYGGVFVSSLDLDDFKGQFCNQGNFPLTKHVKNILFV